MERASLSGKHLFYSGLRSELRAVAVALRARPLESLEMNTVPVDLLAEALPELEGARFAFVFGSYGTPRFNSKSDLDIAVDFGRSLPPREFLGLASRLSNRVERSVDLVDLRSADPIIAMQILRTGKPFLVRDRAALLVFQMTVPSLYFDWKISRRPVEEAMWASARS